MHTHILITGASRGIGAAVATALTADTIKMVRPSLCMRKSIFYG